MVSANRGLINRVGGSGGDDDDEESVGDGIDRYTVYTSRGSPVTNQPPTWAADFKTQ